MESFEQDWGVWLFEEREAEEGGGFGGVGGRGFLEEDVFPGAERPEGPFVVQAVGERDVDGGYGGVVDELCRPNQLFAPATSGPLEDRLVIVYMPWYEVCTIGIPYFFAYTSPFALSLAATAATITPGCDFAGVMTAIGLYISHQSCSSAQTKPRLRRPSHSRDLGRA